MDLVIIGMSVMLSITASIYGVVTNDPYTGVAVTALSASGLLMWRSWNWTMGWRKEKHVAQERERELKGSYQLRDYADRLSRAKGHEEIGLCMVGTYAARQLPALLETFQRAGASDHIGGIYLLELDEMERDMCLRDMPQEFRSHVVVAECQNLPIGLGGCPLEEAEAMKHLWYHDVAEGTRRWLAYLDRETDHALALFFISPGGMSATAKVALDIYHERYPTKPVYLHTIIDHRDVVRERFPDLRKLLTHDGFVRGTILTDNLRSAERSDLGSRTLYAAMTAGAWIGDKPTHMWNGLSYVFSKQRSVRYATLSVWAENLPVYHLPADEHFHEVYYTKADLVEEKITRGVKTLLDRLDLQSVPLEPASSGHMRLLYVITPVMPEPDLATIAKRVDENLKEWREHTDHNLFIHYASIGNYLTPQTQQTPIILLLLQPLADDGTQIDQLALGTHEIDAKFLGKRRESKQQPPVQPQLNGHGRIGRPPKGALSEER